MRAIYTKELLLDGRPKMFADFTVGNVYTIKSVSKDIDDVDWLVENDYGYNHYFTNTKLFEHFKPLEAPKQMTVSAAHQIVALDQELGCLQAELHNLKERIAERQAKYDSLLEEYSVEDL